MASKKDTAILDALQEAERLGIKLGVWKNRNRIEESLGGGFNIDVLVSEEQKTSFESILHRFGFFEAFSNHKRFPGVTHFFRLTGGEPLHIHVYYRLVTGESPLKEYDLPLVDFVLEQTLPDQTYGVSVVNDQAAAYLFVLRHYLKSGSLVGRRSYRRKVLKEKEDFGVNDDFLASVILTADPLGIFPFVKDQEIIGERIPSFASSFRLKWYLRSYLRRSNIYFLCKRNLPVVLRKLSIGGVNKNKRKTIRPSGAVISITGAEATGKSTMVEKIVNNLGRQFEIVYAHVGKPPVFISPFVGALVRILKGTRKEGNSAHSEKKCGEPEGAAENRPDAGFVRRLFDAVKALEVAFSRLVLTRFLTKKARRGSVVITDRWPSMDPGKMDGPRINPNEGMIEGLACRLEMWAYRKIPAANLCIIFSVPLEIALERNAQRVKEGKETAEQVVARHLNNKDTLPKAKRLLCYRNDGALDSSFVDVMTMINEQLVGPSQGHEVR